VRLSNDSRWIDQISTKMNLQLHLNFLETSRAHPPVDDPLTHCSTQDPPTQGALDPPTQGALGSKRDPGTWDGTRCEGPPTSGSSTHPLRVRWDPREIQAPGMGLDVRAHPPVDDPLTHQKLQITWKGGRSIQLTEIT
jgi:hypothetical protein